MTLTGSVTSPSRHLELPALRGSQYTSTSESGLRVKGWCTWGLALLLPFTPSSALGHILARRDYPLQSGDYVFKKRRVRTAGISFRQPSEAIWIEFRKKKEGVSFGPASFPFSPLLVPPPALVWKFSSLGQEVLEPGAFPSSLVLSPCPSSNS